MTRPGRPSGRRWRSRRRLPDPVYIEGELGEGGSATVLTGVGADQRSTVFIDDRGPGTGEIVTIDVATSAARMEPRMRERRIAVKRAVGPQAPQMGGRRMRRRRRGRCRPWRPRLGPVRDQHRRGRRGGLQPGDALDAVVADLEGANVLRVDTAAAERTLEAIPWVSRRQRDDGLPTRGHDRDPRAPAERGVPGRRRSLSRARRRRTRARRDRGPPCRLSRADGRRRAELEAGRWLRRPDIALQRRSFRH